MSTWAVEKKSGVSWVSDGTIARPQANLNKRTQSTQVRVQLADGSYGFIAPETTYNKETMNFFWKSNDGTEKDKVEAYVENQDDVRITDHLSNVYKGRFVSVDAIWLVGYDPDAYDVTAIFELMPDL
jgi:hypothetical protein